MQKRSGQIFNRLSSQMKPHCECFSLQHNLLLLNILLNAFWLHPLFFFLVQLKRNMILGVLTRKKILIKFQGPSHFYSVTNLFS